jgi:hypothetical protein
MQNPLYPRLPGFQQMFEPQVTDTPGDQNRAEDLAQAMQPAVVKAIQGAFAEGHSQE